MDLILDYPFKSHYRDVQGVKLHYLDEGDRSAPVLIFLHGVPTWSYTFRHIIPECTAAGYRVIAPDLPGFGLSEKDISLEIVSLSWLVKVMGEFISQVCNDPPVLFAHDWGGVIGLLLVAEEGDPFSGMILCNSFLPLPGMSPSNLFRLWRYLARFSPLLPIGSIINAACYRELTHQEKNGYNYPFGSATDKSIVRIMPYLFPIGIDHPENERIEKAWKTLETWEKPLLTLFSDGDPITRGGAEILQERIPGARHQNHRIFPGGHFVQEDAPRDISHAILGFMHTLK